MPSRFEEITDEARLAELEGVEGAGLSDNVEDRGIPRIAIAQKGSKQVNKKEPKFINGLEVGNVFNTLTGEMWDAEGEGLPILPCFMRVIWNEWTPQDAGGGFHGSHPRDCNKQAMGAKPREGRRDIFDLPNGNELILTHDYYCVIPESWTHCVIGMKSTDLSASQTLQGLIGARKAMIKNRMIELPAYEKVFTLRTVYDKNDSGDWYRYIVSITGDNNDPNLRAYCRQFALACKRNEVKVVPEESTVTKDDIPV
jgi:hypothetical protein